MNLKVPFAKLNVKDHSHLKQGEIGSYLGIPFINNTASAISIVNLPDTNACMNSQNADIEPGQTVFIKACSTGSDETFTSQITYKGNTYTNPSEGGGDIQSTTTRLLSTNPSASPLFSTVYCSNNCQAKAGVEQQISVTFTTTSTPGKQISVLMVVACVAIVLFLALLCVGWLHFRKRRS